MELLGDGQDGHFSSHSGPYLDTDLPLNTTLHQPGVMSVRARSWALGNFQGLSQRATSGKSGSQRATSGQGGSEQVTSGQGGSEQVTSGQGGSQ